MTGDGLSGPSDTLARIFDAIRAGDAEALMELMDPRTRVTRYDACRPRAPAEPDSSFAEVLNDWEVDTAEELEALSTTDVVRYELKHAVEEPREDLECEILGEVIAGEDRAYVVFRARRLDDRVAVGAPNVATMARGQGAWRWVVTQGGLWDLVGLPRGVGYYDLRVRPFTDPLNVHIDAAPEVVYEWVANAEGRARFWADAAPEDDGVIRFVFPNGERLESPILRAEAPRVFECEYFDGNVVTFEFTGDGRGGTDVHLYERGNATLTAAENREGWVSVLLALKAAVDHDVDLRNHDPQRTWDQGFVDN